MVNRRCFLFLFLILSSTVNAEVDPNLLGVSEGDIFNFIVEDAHATLELIDDEEVSSFFSNLDTMDGYPIGYSPKSDQLVIVPIGESFSIEVTSLPGEISLYGEYVISYGEYEENNQFDPTNFGSYITSIDWENHRTEIENEFNDAEADYGENFTSTLIDSNSEFGYEVQFIETVIPEDDILGDELIVNQIVEIVYNKQTGVISKSRSDVAVTGYFGTYEGITVITGPQLKDEPEFKIIGFSYIVTVQGIILIVAFKIWKRKEE